MARSAARLAADAMSWDELVAAGLDDCGQPLEGHPPLPPVKPWRSSWTSRDGRDADVRRAAAASRSHVQPIVYSRTHHRGRNFVIHRQVPE